MKEFSYFQEDRSLTRDELDLLKQLKPHTVSGPYTYWEIRILAKILFHLNPLWRVERHQHKVHLTLSKLKSDEHHIQCLWTNNGLVFEHEDNDKVIVDHFQQHLGTSTNMEHTFNWVSLGYQQHDLSSLEIQFS